MIAGMEGDFSIEARRYAPAERLSSLIPVLPPEFWANELESSHWLNREDDQ
jgi:hypothetical protein